MAKRSARTSVRDHLTDAPQLRCGGCARALTYEYSIIGGVTPVERWDYFRCPARCGRFEYRQRTRTLKPTAG